MEDIVPIPDSITPLIGYRYWIVHRGWLFSYSRPRRWSSGPQRAHCPYEEKDEDYTIRKNLQLPIPAHIELKRIHHGKPASVECTCGFYCFKYPNPSVMIVEQFRVAGKVSLWGRVQEYGSGYRAEYMQIECLYKARYRRWRNPEIKRIGERYNVPVKEAPIRYWYGFLRHGSQNETINVVLFMTFCFYIARYLVIILLATIKLIVAIAHSF